MSKKHNYTVLSDKRCGCGKRLKQNLVDKKPDADKCYSCHREAHPENPHITAREVRTGKKVGRTWEEKKSREQ